VITGAVLVLVTWAFVVCVVVALGAFPAVLSSPGASGRAVVRRSLWWGLAVASIAALTLNLWLPMRAGSILLVLAVLALVSAGAGAMVWRRSSHGSTPRRPWSWVDIALLVALGAGIAYLALAAVGPVTNYDTGLYHLGAIQYAGDYATMPGLANLFFPLGYSTSQFPMAALLGNGPWDGEGFRLLNGLVIVLMSVDLALRFVRVRATVGSYVLLVGALAAWVPMIALSDYWVTSPSSDSAVFVMTVVATAYLADCAWGGRHWQADASVTIVIGVLLLALRPTMGFFLAAVVVVLALQAVRARDARRRDSWVGWALVAFASLAMVVVLTVRDYFLSGWLQYPLSIHAFNVAWRAPDPINERTATLGNARDPEHLWDAAHGWGWIPTWIGRLPHQWETYQFLALAAAAIVALLYARRVHGGLRLRALALAMVPSLVAAAAWFVASPPSFRFAWGPVFTIGTIPLGWAVFLMTRAGSRHRLASAVRHGGAVVVFAVVGVVLVAGCLVGRFGWSAPTAEHSWKLGPLAIGYRSATIEEPPVVSSTIASGMTVLMPTVGENCWAVFPLCTPRLPPTVHLRTGELQGGFLP